MLAVFQLEDPILLVGHVIAVLGVGVIVLGLVIAGTLLVRDLTAGKPSEEIYQACRLRVGRGLVLGLEVLVAADIVETVAIEPTFTSVGVLALIVAVRTFLGWSLTVELEGRWPWQAKEG